MPSRSGVPGPPRRPPITTRSGFSTLQRSASGRPIARPASTSRRRGPLSPARAEARQASASRSDPDARSTARAPARRRRSAGSRGRRRAERAVRIDGHVPELARQPRGAPVEAAADQESGADARRDLHVDDVGGAARRAEARLGERAQVRVVLDCDRHAQALAQRRRRMDADPAGQDHGRSDDAVRRSIGRAAPSPPPPAGSCRRRVREHLVGQLGRRVDRLARGCADPDGVSRSARTSPDRSATATRTWQWPKSTASAAPARAASAMRMPGRPACGSRPGRGRVGRSARTPWSSSSPTTAEAVVRDSPVWRASAARLSGPSTLRASITARRLRSRRLGMSPA